MVSPSDAMSERADDGAQSRLPARQRLPAQCELSVAVWCWAMNPITIATKLICEALFRNPRDGAPAGADALPKVALRARERLCE
jgi:hypothetical protein